MSGLRTQVANAKVPAAPATPQALRRAVQMPEVDGGVEDRLRSSSGADLEAWSAEKLGFDLSSVPIHAPARLTARNSARIARSPAAPLSTPSLGTESLHVTDPSEPDEISADRFADAALAVMSHAVKGSHAPSQLATPAATLPSPLSAPPREAPAREAPVELEEPEQEQFEQSPLGALGAGAGADDVYEDSNDDPADRLARAAVGTPLGAALRGQIEPLVGMDLGRVRIHADTESAALAERFQARAFAHQRDIFFAPGEFTPGTRSGMHLLLHELAHVVQQSAERPSRRVIARAPSGRAMHALIEKTLLAHHPDLIAEAALPGGNTGGTDLDKLGYPDLYRSSSGNKVPWVRGQYADDGTLKYVPMPRPTRGHPHAHSGNSQHEPTVDGKGNFKGDFPTNFAVAEIKPAGITASAKEKIGEGLAQSSNYVDGFPKFAEKARADGKTKNVPVASSLTRESNFLPPAIDYNNFNTEAGKKAPAKPNLVMGKERYWLYPMQKSPVLFYFSLPHPYAASDYTRALDKVFAELEGLKHTLGQDKVGPTIAKKRSGRRVARRKPRARVARKKDWKAAHATWEKDRAAWDDTKAKPYLKTDAAKAVEQKAKVDRFIGLPVTENREGAERARKQRQVELFSGKTGKVLGEIRYALGPVFEKIAPFFQWLKKKLGALIGKLKQTKRLSLSWAQTIFDAVLKALGTTVQEAIWLLFGMFQDCIVGMVDHFIESFLKDLTEELTQPFEEAKHAFFNWLGVDENAVGQLVTDIEASLQKYEAIIDQILDAKRLVDEIRVYEYAIRGIVQAISCASPPLVGCLWGAAAQLALPAIVDLAMTSDLFQDKVVRPLVRDLVKDILDEPFSRIVSTSIEAIGLGKWAKDVSACKIKPIDVKKIIDQAIEPGLKLDDPQLLKKRDAWNKQHEGEILGAAANQFVKKDGKSVTPNELKQLMDQTKDLLPSAGTMSDAIARAKRADGKIDFEKFADWAHGKVAATPQATRRGGFSADGGGTPTAAQVKAKLDKLALAKVSANRLVELLEDSRDDEGRVNIDQFERKVDKHLERQQIKRDVEAQQPDMPGVPKQTGGDLVAEKNGEPSKDEMRELVESLADGNLGELSAAEKVEALRGPDGKIDAKALKRTVDAAAAGLPTAGTAPPATGPQDPEPSEAQKPKPKDADSGTPGSSDATCKGPLCVSTSPADSGGTKFGPVDVGPQNFGNGESGSVLPGIGIPLPDFGGKPKKKP